MTDPWKNFIELSTTFMTEDGPCPASLHVHKEELHKLELGLMCAAMVGEGSFSLTDPDGAPHVYFAHHSVAEGFLDALDDYCMEAGK